MFQETPSTTMSFEIRQFVGPSQFARFPRFSEEYSLKQVLLVMFPIQSYLRLLWKFLIKPTHETGN